MVVMRPSTLVRVEEYLSTDYRPDCDYVEGEVQERNVGEYEHGKWQAELIIFLAGLRRKLGFHIVPEQRLQVKPRRFRVPDICVILGPEPEEQVLTQPPFLCIEILSPEDRMVRIEERIDDYLEFGVSYVWLINPQSGKAWIHSAAGVREAKDGVLKTADPEISVPLSDLFRQK